MAKLDQSLVDTLRGYLARAESSFAAGDTVNALNYINLYYQAQTDFRGYASDALQVINNIGQFGNIANQDAILGIGQARYDQIRNELMVDLAKADLNTIIRNGNGVPTSNQIADYHYDVYQKLGIPATNFGGAAAAALGQDWSLGTLKPAEYDKDLSDNRFGRNFGQAETQASVQSIVAAGTQKLGSGTFGDVWNAARFADTLNQLYEDKYGPMPEINSDFPPFPKVRVPNDQPNRGQTPVIGPQGYNPDGSQPNYGAAKLSSGQAGTQLYSTGGAPQSLDPNLFASPNGGTVTANNGAGMPGGDTIAMQPGTGGTGRLISSPSADGYGRDYFIDLGRNIPPVQLARAQANDIAFGIDGLADQIDTSGLRGELQTVYHDLNSPDPSQDARPWTPQAAGLAGGDVGREYISEAIRAYLADPGYMQAMAPNTVAAIQDALNANPQVAGNLQANGIMPFLIGGTSTGATATGSASLVP